MANENCVDSFHYLNVMFYFSDTDQRLKIDENPSTNQDEGDQPSTSAARLESASDNEDSNTHHGK